VCPHKVIIPPLIEVGVDIKENLLSVVISMFADAGDPEIYL